MDAELKKIAQVLHNKIYNENSRFYEQLAYLEQEYISHVLLENDVSLHNIVMSIQLREDLNSINGLDMKNYLDIDLNAFLMKVIAIRKFERQSYAEMIEKQSLDLFMGWLEPVLDCFTEEESIPIKRAFIKRLLNYSDIDSMDIASINNLFFTLYKAIKIQIEKSEEKLSL